ncbi:MAG: hypothetical protein WDZ94_04555, partial [Patescibacteria group bacterium]
MQRHYPHATKPDRRRRALALVIFLILLFFLGVVVFLVLRGTNWFGLANQSTIVFTTQTSPDEPPTSGSTVAPDVDSDDAFATLPPPTPSEPSESSQISTPAFDPDAWNLVTTDQLTPLSEKVENIEQLLALLQAFFVNNQLAHTAYDAYANLGHYNHLNTVQPSSLLTRSQIENEFLRNGAGLADLAEINLAGLSNGQILEWDGSEWVATDNEGTTYSAGDGLTLDGSTFQLGGNLSQNTAITLGGFDLAFTGGNVGIGTTNPASALHVTSSARFGGNVLFESTTTMGGLTYTWPTSESSGFILQTDGSGGLAWVDPSALPGVSSGQWTISNGALHPFNNTVDVLVGGNATASAGFRVVGSGSAMGDVHARQFIDKADTDYFLWPSNSGDAGALAGNLGIGSTQPNFKLDVIGTGRFSGALQLDTLASGSTDTVLTHSSGVVQQRTIDSRVWSPSSLVDGSGTAGHVSYWSSTNSLSSEQFLSTVRGGLGANVTAGGAGELLYSTNTTSYDTLNAGTSGQTLISGGAGAPGWGTLGLTYGGTNANLSGVATGGLIYADGVGLAGTAPLTGVLKGNGSSAPTAMTGSADYVTRWTDANTLGTGVLYDNATNVGINTTNPQFRLEVIGTGRFSEVLTLGTQATTTDHAVRADRAISAGNGLTGGGNLTADRSFTIDSPTCTSTDKLQWNGTAFVCSTDVDTDTFLGLTDAPNSYTSAGFLVRINASTDGLEFVDPSTVGTNFWKRIAGNLSPTTTNDTISATSSAATVATFTATGSNLALRAGGSTASTTLNILADGNVGIGTNSPNNLLDVQGGSGIVAQFSGRVIGADAVNTDEFITLGQLNTSTYWQKVAGVLSPFLAEPLAATSSATTVATFTADGSNDAAQIGGVSSYVTIDASGNILFTNASGSTIDASGTLSIGGTTQTGLVLGRSTVSTRIANLTTDGVVYTSGSDGTLNTEAQLAIARGGTNSTATPTAGAVAYGDGSAYAFSSAGTTGQPLLSGGTGTPTWDTLGLVYGGTNADLSGVATGGLIYKGATALTGTGALTGVLKGNGSSAPTAMTGTANYVTRWTDANTLGTGVLYDDATNVGIGTTDPATFRLQVAGTVGPQTNDAHSLGSDALRWANVYGVLGDFSTSVTTPLVTNAGNLTLAATGTNNLIFQTDSTTRWTVNSSGVLVSNGSQTIQTSTGALTIATGAGDGNITLSPDGVGTIQATAHFLPNADNTLDLGASATRWANIYGTNVIASAMTQNGFNVCDESGNCTSSGLWDNNDNILHPRGQLASVVDLALGGTSTASANIHLLADGSAVFNQQGNDADFRVEASGQANALFVQGSDGNVGIGTSNPARKLEIADSGAFPLSLYRSANTALSGVALEFALQDSNNARQVYGDIYAGITTNTAGSEDGFLGFRTASVGNVAERMRINPTGNVGIGTTDTADFKLQILGSIGPQANDTYDLGSAALRWRNGYFATSVDSPLVTNVGNVDISATGSNQVRFMTDSSVRWTVNSSGVLVSAGSQSIQTSTGNLTLATGGGNGNIVLAPNGTGLIQANADLLPNTDNTLDLGSDSLRWAEAHATNFYQSGNQVCDNSGNCSTSGLWQNNSNVFHPRDEFASIADLALGGTATASANIHLRSDGQGYFAGNVGIGTTSPNTKLHLFRSGGESVATIVSDENELAGVRIGSHSSGTRAKAGIFFNRNGSSWDRGDLVFATNSTADGSLAGLSDARMTIKSGGNVGIGTTDPTAPLTIGAASTTRDLRIFTEVDALPSGDGAFMATTGGGGSGVYANFGALLISARNQNTGSSEVHLMTSQTPRLSIVQGGNVGIGTSDPGEKLNVVDNSTAWATEIQQDNTGGGGLHVSTAGSSTDRWALRTTTGAGTAFAVRNDGNVGIGTTSPARILHTVGDAVR